MKSVERFKLSGSVQSNCEQKRWASTGATLNNDKLSSFECIDVPYFGVTEVVSWHHIRRCHNDHQFVRQNVVCDVTTVSQWNPWCGGNFIRFWHKV